MLRSHYFVSAASNGAIKDETCGSAIRRRTDQGHNADHQRAQERALDKSTTRTRREYFEKTNPISDDRATLPGAKEPFLLAYGQVPGKTVTANVEPLQPGANIDLSVDQHSCEWTKKSLLEMDSRALAGNHATARIDGVVFNDETAWFGGVAHVMEPNNPLRWNVVRSKAQNDSPMFSFLNVGLWENSNAVSNNQSCYDWLDTVFVDCCGFVRSSAVMVLAPFSHWQPLPRQSECQPGVICEWIKAVDCSGPSF